MKNRKNTMIWTLVIVILLMAVGYSVFATQLNINGTVETIGEWDVRITNIKVKEISEGCDGGNPQFTNTTVTFDAKLEKPGDEITYAITVKNLGRIDAKLGTVIFMEGDGTPAINYETKEIKPLLSSGEQATILVKVEYVAEVNEMPSSNDKKILGIIEYVQE